MKRTFISCLESVARSASQQRGFACGEARFSAMEHSRSSCVCSRKNKLLHAACTSTACDLRDDALERFSDVYLIIKHGSKAYAWYREFHALPAGDDVAGSIFESSSWKRKLRFLRLHILGSCFQFDKKKRTYPNISSRL